MEWIETLLPLILLALYFLSQIGKRRNQPERPAAPKEPLATPTVAPGDPARRTPFEELIRQIQQAAEEAQASQTPAAPKPPPAAPPRPTPGLPVRPRPLRPPPARHPLAPSIEAEFRPVGGFEHEQHGFGPDNPFSEEAFTRLPRGADVTAHAPGHLLHDPHNLFQPKGQPAPKSSHPLAERLRHSGSARDAFALREILDAPRARRRR